MSGHEIGAPANVAGRTPLGTLPADANGLSEAEAARRLASTGPNELAAAGHTWTRLLLGQLRSPLLGLLAAAAAVSIALGEGVEGAIILGIMALSVGLGVVNEYAGERTLEALRARTGRRATALRDGRPRELPAAEMVPGDVCLLQIGDVVPADLALIAAADLSVDESTLTGEAEPVDKRLAADGGGAGGVRAYAGTVVRGGSGRGVVVATGRRTRMGGLAGRLAERQPPTAFQRGLTSFAGLLARVTAVLATSIFVINALLGRPLLDSLLFSLAIAVGLTPQLLPAIVSVSLSTGARRMARRDVLVKRLVAIEDLGDADVLFTDKTGTLTRGEITALDPVGPDGRPAPHLAERGLVCGELSATQGDHPLGNALDLALWRHFEPAVAREYLRSAPRLDLIPFTFERRRVAVVLGDHEGRRTLVCKGASEEVLARCATARCAGVSRPMDEAAPLVTATLEGLLAAGRRTLALAERPLDGAEVLSEADEHDLELLGFLVFSDPPKPDAAEAVDRLQRLGVRVKLLTGDHAHSATRLCAEVGLTVSGVVSGEELRGLEPDALARAVAGASVFARVSPEQKADIVAAEQAAGHDVAFIGDGVNDAVALRRADVGICVDTAVDVAREAADVVLLKSGLGVVADGVAEGRRIFANTMKYVLMGTSSNFGNMFSAAGASLVLSFLPMLPSQILLNNLLYDVSELTIPTDRVDEEALVRPGRWDIGFIRRFMTFFGPISSVYDVLTFVVMIEVFHAGPELFRSGWFVESLATQALVVFVVRTRRVPFLRSRPSPALLATTLAVVLAGVLIPFSPVAGALGFVPLPPAFLAILAGMVVTYLAVAEVGKAWFYRHIRLREVPR